MVLVRALPDEYSHFVSSLLVLDKLDKDSITQAFLTEEISRRRRAEGAATSAAAMAVAAASSSCEFCLRPGHVQATCRSFAYAQRRARGQAGPRRDQQQAKKAQEAPAVLPTSSSAPVKEFAGNASAVPTLPRFDPTPC